MRVCTYVLCQLYLGCERVLAARSWAPEARHSWRWCVSLACHCDEASCLSSSAGCRNPRRTPASRSWPTDTVKNHNISAHGPTKPLGMQASTFGACPNHHDHNRFTALFPGPPRWASARRELLDFMVQGKINRGRHTDHPAGRHSIRTNQCPPPPFPHFLQAGCPSCCPTNSVKALKAPSAFGLGRRH